MKKEQIKKGKEAKKKVSKAKEKRTHHMSFKLNDKEFKAVQRHLKKYKITNRSDWFRTTILTQIWQKLGEDLPMLFDEKEMRQGPPLPMLFDENDMQSCDKI